MIYLTNARKAEAMADVVDALIVDLLAWVESSERSYAETMEAWRTSCPRLPVWEDANDRGLVTREQANGHAIVKVTPAGLALLERCMKSRTVPTS
jgi:hypothetical protein